MATFWKPDSKAVANALLRHRHQISLTLPLNAEISDYTVERCTITYDRLRIAAGIGGIARGVGVHLRKTREWCSIRGFPPLDSFVVRSGERNPGDGYDETPESYGDWREDVRRCLGFQGYPKSID